MSFNNGRANEAETEIQHTNQHHQPPDQRPAATFESNNNDLHKRSPFASAAGTTTTTNLDAQFPSLGGSSNSNNSDSHSNSLSRRSVDVHTLDIHEQPYTNNSNSNSSNNSRPTSFNTDTTKQNYTPHQHTSGNGVPYGNYRYTLPFQSNLGAIANTPNNNNIPTIQPPQTQDDNFKLFTIYGNGEFLPKCQLIFCLSLLFLFFIMESITRPLLIVFNLNIK